MSASVAVLRLVLILAVLLGPLAGPRAAADPALAMARAAGSLCMGDGPEGFPAAGHDHCMACQVLTGWTGLVPTALALVLPGATQAAWRPAAGVDVAIGWRAYASRAPPPGFA